jgi:hypothetical protein
MTASYYKILFVSLGITVGLFLMFYGYRYMIRSVKRETSKRSYAKLYNLEGLFATGIVTFHFEIPETGMTRFEICNESLEVILPVFNTEKQEGSHTENFDTTKLPDGKYYYQLTVNGQTIFKLMKIKNG